MCPDTCFIFMDGSESNTALLREFLDAHMTAIEAWIRYGGTLFLNAAPNDGDGTYPGTPLPTSPQIINVHLSRCKFIRQSLHEDFQV